MAKTTKMSSKDKHITVDYDHFHEEVEDGNIRLQNIDNTAPKHRRIYNLRNCTNLSWDGKAMLFTY
jgi:hypothetical protein